ncbi:MAG: DUF1254 domain-containing protein [Betaproteobacteria bacterium]
MKIQRLVPALVLAAGSLLPGPAALAGTPLSPAEARAIARDAVIYGFPLVDHYRVQHAYFVDHDNPEFKADWNQLRNIPRVFTPEDKAIQTPNSDTPYSFAGLDLRAEPVVLTLPPVTAGRYHSVQLIDAYTHNFAYLGTRTTGNEGGNFMIAGPGWTGATPPGVKRVLRAETSVAFAAFRTQLFEASDLENVKAVQAGYRVQPLSAFLGKAAPRVKPVAFVAPLTPEQQKNSLNFFQVLNFVLGFCPVHPSERALMKRFARLGVGSGLRFHAAGLLPPLRQAVEEGMADAWADFAAFKKTRIETGEVTSGDLFGTRAFLRKDYMRRMAGAVLGIYGNSREEAMYPTFFTDASGAPLDGATRRYALRFAPGELPPVDAFWSLTLYELPSSLLSANAIGRYLINSPMLPRLVRDTDGGITLLIQHESPGPEREAKWLPAPKGRFWMSLRLYLPKAEAIEGRWKPPGLQAAAVAARPAGTP